jgi:hypothetical protein
MFEKPITTETSILQQQSPSVVGFNNPSEFDNLIKSRGFEVEYDKALRCPCITRESGNASSTCINCGGLGWLFTQRKKTRMLISGRNFSKKQENWGEVDLGIARVTSMPVDRMTFMDRIILTELEAINTEVIYPKRRENGDVFAYTIYNPIDLQDIYLFVGNNKQLEKLSADVFDLSLFDKGVLKFVDSGKYSNMLFHKEEDISLSIRYTHNPCYHIIDVNRDLVKTRVKKCNENNEVLTDLPLSYLAKKAQYIFDKHNLSGLNIINQ